MLPHVRPQDVIDIAVITVLVYQLYRWFRNTRALQVVIGLGFLGVLYLVTKSLGLFMTSWIMQELGTVLFVLIIVVFQGEIRQALYRFSLLRHGIGRQDAEPRVDLCQLAEAVFSLAAARLGALIVIERRERLDDYLQHGISLDAQVSPQLLETIFQRASSLHDGAVVIKKDRITHASCHLPLAIQSDLPAGCGTRHRAALGLSERADAVVIVVSEERGSVSLAVGQELSPVPSSAALQGRLADLLTGAPDATPAIIREGFFTDMGAKTAVFCLVLASWLILTTRQGEIITVAAPVRLRNLPEHLTLQRSTPEEVDIQLKVLSSLIPSPKQLDIVAELDLARVHEGVNQLPLRNEDIRLPIGVKISQIKPGTVKVAVARKQRKRVPVRVVTMGAPAGDRKLRRVTVEPSSVLVEGPEQAIAALEGVEVEGIDLRSIRQTVSMERPLLSPSSQVKVVHDAPVKVRIVVGK